MKYILLGLFIVTPISIVYAKKNVKKNKVEVKIQQEYEYSPMEKRNAGINYKIISYIISIILAIVTTIVYRRKSEIPLIKMKSVFIRWLLHGVAGYIATVLLSFIILISSDKLGMLGLEPLKSCLSDPIVARQVGLSFKIGGFMVAHVVDLLIVFTLVYGVLTISIAMVKRRVDKGG